MAKQPNVEGVEGWISPLSALEQEVCIHDETRVKTKAEQILKIQKEVKK